MVFLGTFVCWVPFFLLLFNLETRLRVSQFAINIHIMAGMDYRSSNFLGFNGFSHTRLTKHGWITEWMSVCAYSLFVQFINGFCWMTKNYLMLLAAKRQLGMSVLQRLQELSRIRLTKEKKKYKEKRKEYYPKKFIIHYFVASYWLYSLRYFPQKNHTFFLLSCFPKCFLMNSKIWMRVIFCPFVYCMVCCYYF